MKGKMTRRTSGKLWASHERNDDGLEMLTLWALWPWSLVSLYKKENKRRKIQLTHLIIIIIYYYIIESNVQTIIMHLVLLSLCLVDILQYEVPNNNTTTNNIFVK